jgi:alpha-ketoglutarate-dependent taurine dioxygenase
VRQYVRRPYGELVKFADLVAGARRDGWITPTVGIEEIRRQAAASGWAEVPVRPGDQPVAVLKPVQPESARPRSLSARYGLGDQPLHTDGAHLASPPDLVVLAAAAASGTPTRLWAHSRAAKSSEAPPWSSFSHGMFLVHAGRDSFYAPAVTGSRWRFDPGCMTPCDARARHVGEYLAAQLERAWAWEWTRTGQVLVIDNRSVLHARAAVADGDEDRELTRVAFREGDR